ncbi:LysR substrate-binding domain-containing protein [Massilia sp. TS11]|uniref:LysR substrate-binding domain-containing protein n=1 Tax=Massilia sp. TS11 TaxID=2908003 RepID=UPI001EDA71CA|nr:LysR substrate-binding domain-containing protein [Massilia sp. TS11]
MLFFVQQVVGEALLVYPKAPRPSFADQVLAAFAAAGLVPEQVSEVRELQVAMGLVAAGQGIAIVPESVQGMHQRNVIYRPLEDKHAFSPIFFSARSQDRTPELESMLAAVYATYDQLGIPYTPTQL